MANATRRVGFVSGRAYLTRRALHATLLVMQAADLPMKTTRELRISTRPLNLSNRDPSTMRRTLSSFTWLLAGDKKKIECPRIYLDGWFDGAPPVFEGSGTLMVSGTTDFSFHMHARPHQEVDAMNALRLASEQRYDPKTAFRLRAVDYSGTEWNGGWVRPGLGELQSGYWQLVGVSDGLSTVVQQTIPTSGVELVYSPAPDLPFSESITTAHIGDTEIGSRTSGGRHSFNVLGSDIEVSTEPWSNELWVIASANADLNHPYLENWLSEPLRALRGQLIFPRLVARNFADGRAFVSLRQAPTLRGSLGGCATQLRAKSAPEFWEFYERYLTYIARHRAKDGHPEFEANPMTRFHEEVIQAHLAGSHWVLALCVASAIEGIVRLGLDFKATLSEFSAEEVSPVERFLKELKLDSLRDKLNSMVAQLGKPSVARYLSNLAAVGHVDKDHVAAWKRIRNRVAHGNLFEPWGTQDEDAQLVKLVELLYRLTALRIVYLTDKTSSTAQDK